MSADSSPRLGVDRKPLKDARRSPRVSFTTEVWLGQDGIFTRTHERFGVLSTHGAFLELSDGYTVDSVLNLKFALPGDDELIMCTALVRSSRLGGGIGVEFLDLSPESRTRIAAFVDKAVT